MSKINFICIFSVIFYKLYRVSFSNINPSAIESGICTPITNYLNQKNFDQKKLNEMIVPKLNNLKREKDNSNSNEGFANRNIYHNRNQSNNFNISEISNFSLKNNSSIFQGKIIIIYLFH